MRTYGNDTNRRNKMSLEVLDFTQLEETENGKLKDLTAENIRMDVVQKVAEDFFGQFAK